MLKLPKGLKKKKKKSKKDQELFTEEELEQYKQKLKQQQQHEGEPSTEITSPEKPNSDVKPTEQNFSTAQTVCAPLNTEGAAATTESATEQNKTSEEDEEWKRFKELTSGIDSVLHKTQDELQRIKESSFYQRLPTAVEKQKLEEEENRRRAEEKKRREEEAERRRKEEEEANRDKLAEAVVELSESEDESEEVDDIFNTEYIDAITSGEVQLGIVPDSPELELNEGPDPFDTTYADKLIKGPDVSKRGKKIVSLGSAVEVLTGRVDSAHAVALSGAKKKPRRGIQNLLFDESIDEDTLHAIESELPVTPEPPRTLLDELEDDILDGPIDLSKPLCIDLLKQHRKEKTAEGDSDDLENNEDLFDTSILNFSTVKRTEEPNKPLISDDILSEFDVLNTQEDDEFAELAVESLSKKQDVKNLHKVNQIAVAGIVATVDVKFTVDFEFPEKVKPARPPPPVRPEGFVDLDDDDLGADDPFDTAFVEQIVPKNDEEDDFDFDPRAGEEETEKTVITNLYESTLSGLKVTNKKDLLEGSATDLTKLEDTPIATTQEKDTELDENFDPFDTSAVSKIVQPKETELKFIEKELLADSNLNRSLSDPDFDPRAEEPIAPAQTVAPPVEFDSARRKSSLSLNLASKSVGFLVPSNNLPVAEGETGKIQKPLTPYYAKPEAILEKDSEDPFDTSFVPKQIPTEVELKHIEKDLLASSNLQHSLSDPDFDPRAEENPTAEDLLSAKDQINTKVLTPRHEAIPKIEKRDFEDPFDTSIASNIKPGATELKLLENELLPCKISEPTAVLDTLSDAQELGLGDKVLTPQISVSFSLDIEEVDPFDTSIAENLAPGKTEIKILESEFVGK